MSQRETTNKIYLITGGTTGIGAATAALLAEQGAKVIVTGLNAETLRSARAAAPAGVEVVESDASDLGAIAELEVHIAKSYGSIDGVFLNAGIAPFAPLEAWDEATFDRLYRTNVKGPFFAAQKLAPRLRPGGSLLFNTSVVADIGLATAAAYGGTKNALRAIVRSLSVELAPRGLRVNAVAPGPIATPIYDKMGMSAAQLAGFSDHFATRVPLGRFGVPAEIAGAAAFLLSDRASFITGTELVVDGGLRNHVG